MKRCTKCGQEKSPEDFDTTLVRGKRYLRSWCKACCLVSKRQRYHRKRPDAPWIHAEDLPHFDEALGLEVRRCRTCGALKPLSEFHKHLSINKSHCKECRLAHIKEQYTADPEQFRSRSRKWRETHIEQARERLAQWEATNREYRLAYHQRKNDERREAQREYRRARRAAMTPEQRAEFDRRFNQYRRRLLGLHIGIVLFTREEIIERDQSTCYLCGQLVAPDNIHLDHVIPLTRGGTHSAENLRVTCKRCNLRKGTKLLSELDWTPEHPPR